MAYPQIPLMWFPCCAFRCFVLLNIFTSLPHYFSFCLFFYYYYIYLCEGGQRKYITQATAHRWKSQDNCKSQVSPPCGSRGSNSCHPISLGGKSSNHLYPAAISQAPHFYFINFFFILRHGLIEPPRLAFNLSSFLSSLGVAWIII